MAVEDIDALIEFENLFAPAEDGGAIVAVVVGVDFEAVLHAQSHEEQQQADDKPAFAVAGGKRKGGACIHGLRLHALSVPGSGCCGILPQYADCSNPRRRRQDESAPRQPAGSLPPLAAFTRATV